MFERVHRLILRVNFNFDRVIQRSSLQFLDLGRHRCGEEISVALFGDLGQNQVDLLLKIHRQKTVSFVKD